jgi:hypothetical protein
MLTETIFNQKQMMLITPLTRIPKMKSLKPSQNLDKILKMQNKKLKITRN